MKDLEEAMIRLIKENPGQLTKRKLWKRLDAGNRMEFEEAFYKLLDKEFKIENGFLYPKRKPKTKVEKQYSKEEAENEKAKMQEM